MKAASITTMTHKDQLLALFKKFGSLSYQYRKTGSSYAKDLSTLKELIKEKQIARSFKNQKVVYFVYIGSSETSIKQ